MCCWARASTGHRSGALTPPCNTTPRRSAPSAPPLGARYSPGNYRTVNAAYRLQRGTSEQIDVGWQWPLAALWGGKGADRERAQGQGKGSGRWYSVGRLNYSLQDRKLVDTVVGFEYDSCCWIGRVVLERLQSSVTTSNTRLLFQIEFVGFSRLSLGASPLETLRQMCRATNTCASRSAPPAASATMTDLTP
jgi:LPS-assembly protein